MANTSIGKKFTKAKAEKFRRQILGWYGQHARILPWRYTKNQKPDPYRVWLSEIMLQQTTVAAVQPYFNKFIEKWPTVEILAAADERDVMNAWAGLGYYSRARNLHKCARIVAGELGGVFPQNQGELKKLPGIGDYTSAAIRTIAYNKQAIVVDGNIERIMARYFAWQKPMPEAKRDLKRLAAPLFEKYEERPGDLAQALMDLGATICTPKSPRCGFCPVSTHCEARKQSIAALLPLQNKKSPRPKKFGSVYWITNSKGEVLVHHRPPRGMLGGMAGLPTSEWTAKRQGNSQKPPVISKNHKINSLRESVNHSFTHFDLELTLKTCRVKSAAAMQGYSWIPPDKVENTGFPTLFKKAAALFLKEYPSG